MNFNILEYTNFKLNNSTNEKNMSEKPKLVDNKGINFTDLGGSSTIIESEQESKKQYKKA